mmetsp:Transcript_18913/g.39359  ORF Transcript_18913/g.39359 Transcript_18913/m.39359 type:complete len:310 (+) Transcript_18913:6179-7108(+)
MKYRSNLNRPEPFTVSTTVSDSSRPWESTDASSPPLSFLRNSSFSFFILSAASRAASSRAFCFAIFSSTVSCCGFSSSTCCDMSGMACILASLLLALSCFFASFLDILTFSCPSSPVSLTAASSLCFCFLFSLFLAAREGSSGFTSSSESTSSLAEDWDAVSSAESTTALPALDDIKAFSLPSSSSFFTVSRGGGLSSSSFSFFLFSFSSCPLLSTLLSSIMFSFSFSPISSTSLSALSRNFKSSSSCFTRSSSPSFPSLTSVSTSSPFPSSGTVLAAGCGDPNIALDILLNIETLREGGLEGLVACWD